MRKLCSLLASILLLALATCGGGAPPSRPRVIVLGVDGLDPKMLQERIAGGLLPNFARLEKNAFVTDLGTSWPPQSPVAWTNFVTGVNPGKHGLYDFIRLDRRNYGLLTSMTETSTPWLDRRLAGCIPVQLGASMKLTRTFPAFWDVLAKAGVPVSVHRVPANFPVEETSPAVVFPDMGTPDLAGAAAGVAFLWFERSELADERGWSSRAGSSYIMEAVELNRLRLDDRGRGVATASSVLTGPPDGDDKASVPVSFYVDTTGADPVLAVDVKGAVAIAPAGSWSAWLPVQFSLSCGIDSVSGWTRFYFVSAQPFAVYACPVQIDPWAPAMPVSSPKDASAHLADVIGPYYTQGFPDAYKAYKVGLLTTEEFLSESDTVMGERLKMLSYAMDEFDRKGGLLFFYTGALDMRCHMLWHQFDPGHPHREKGGDYEALPSEYVETASRLGLRPGAGMSYAQQIDRVYMQVDDLLGYLLANVEKRWPGSELIVMSDHGFSTMRRVMNVNDWLLREGYLVLRRAGSTGDIAANKKTADGAVDFGSSIVNWDRTVAFSVGFNGIFLNRKGREPRGIVEDSRARVLVAEMQQKLLALKDEDGTRVLTKVLPATDVYKGNQLKWAPDIELGFNLGYGASDPSAEGKVTGERAIVPNDSRWSGSHLMDPDLVKGVLIVRGHEKLKVADPNLEDVTATLYELFSVKPPAGIDGRPLLYH